MPESWTVTRTYLREVPVAPAQDGAPFRLRNLTPQGTIVEVESSSSPGKPPLLRRLAPALALLVLSPVCAEYLIGYDQIIGHPWELISGLLLLAPLYGTVAVIIREVTRRTGRGWPTILLLSMAFGVVEAGLIDQSLFNPHSFSDASWAEGRLPTLIPALGISVHNVLGFVGGHVIWSFAAPIVVIESCVPQLADRPWLRRGGMTAMVALYALAVVIFFHEHTKKFMASPAQLGIAATVALTLAVTAFVLPRRRATVPGRVPPPWLAGGGAVVLLATHQLVPPSWSGTAVDGAVLVLGGGLLLYWSRRERWGRLHALMVGGAALVVNAGLSFAVEPLGAPTSHVAKYGANVVLMLAVVALLAWAFRRVHHHVRQAGPTTDALRHHAATAP